MFPILRSFVRINVNAVPKHLAWLYGALLWAGLLASCSGRGSGWLSPVSSGRPYDVLVVASDGTWQQPVDLALTEALGADVPGLPQPECSFRLMRAAPENFDATLRLMRNIVVVDIDSQYARPAFRYARDVYASPQLILTVQAPDARTLARFVTGNAEAVVSLFTHEEMSRRALQLEEQHNDYASRRLREMFGCDVWIPAELSAFKEGTDFFWAGTRAATDDRYFVMYAYPYEGDGAWSKVAFVHKRDSVLKANIPGAGESIYMATDSLMTDVRILPPQGRFALEARGLWRMEGDFMGGPFVAMARLDKAKRHVVVAEVFVYAPGREKRNLLRDLEASLYTWRWTGDGKKEQAYNNINK